MEQWWGENRDTVTTGLPLRTACRTESEVFTSVSQLCWDTWAIFRLINGVQEQERQPYQTIRSDFVPKDKDVEGSMSRVGPLALRTVETLVHLARWPETVRACMIVPGRAICWRKEGVLILADVSRGILNRPFHNLGVWWYYCTESWYQKYDRMSDGQCVILQISDSRLVLIYIYYSVQACEVLSSDTSIDQIAYQFQNATFQNQIC